MTDPLLIILDAQGLELSRGALDGEVPHPGLMLRLPDGRAGVVAKVGVDLSNPTRAIITATVVPDDIHFTLVLNGGPADGLVQTGAAPPPNSRDEDLVPGFRMRIFDRSQPVDPDAWWYVVTERAGRVLTLRFEGDAARG